ncbi:MAG: hypothetical protein ACYDEG_10600, partial [bacterium]
MENQNKERILLGTKDRLKIKRHDMPAKNPKERVQNFKEVAIGYSIEDAIEEAKRCIDCKVPYCIQGCPVSIDIPAFIKLIEKGDFLGAAKKI